MKHNIVDYLRIIAPYARAHDPSTQNGLTWPLTSGLMEAAAEIERLRAYIVKFPCTCMFNKPMCTRCEVMGD